MAAPYHAGPFAGIGPPPSPRRDLQTGQEEDHALDQIHPPEPQTKKPLQAGLRGDINPGSVADSCRGPPFTAASTPDPPEKNAAARTPQTASAAARIISTSVSFDHARRCSKVHAMASPHTISPMTMMAKVSAAPMIETAARGDGADCEN